MSRRKLRVEEVALSVGVSVKTINNWYQFKKENPDNKFAKMLPDFQQEHPRATRFWYTEDIWKILEFRKAIPKTGRAGIMGSITQKYIKKEA